jgi:glycosyltransferase involved in cell wall biosynthesis
LRKGILYLQYTNPACYPPLEHSSHLLADHGWQVLFLGTASRDAASLRFDSHSNIHVAQLPFCPPGWKQKLHFSYFHLWSAFHALRFQPSWIYASDTLSCSAAILISRLTRSRVIYHEHDSPVEISRPSAFMRLIRSARRTLARRAAINVLPNSERGEKFRLSTGTHSDVLCVWNCPARRDVPQPGAIIERTSPAALVVFYHGSIVPARLPLAVIHALRLLPETVSLRIAGYATVGAPGYVDEIVATAKRLGIVHRVQIIGEVPTRAGLLAECRKADIGLALMPLTSADLNERAMAGASNKPFDYMASGLALLISDLPDWKSMFAEAGFAKTCDPSDPASIAGALAWFVENRNETRAMGERGRAKILSNWNYEEQFAPVLAKMQDGLAR